MEMRKMVTEMRAQISILPRESQKTLFRDVFLPSFVPRNGTDLAQLARFQRKIK
jgi:hypothetical protein